MKDLKNIVVEIWELFFPLAIRVAISVVIVLIITQNQDVILFETLSTYLKLFVENSKQVLKKIDLENFFGIYILVTLILFSLTFNSLLKLLNSLFRVSIYWKEMGLMEPYGFSKLLHYFPETNNRRDLELQIKTIHSSAIEENNHKLGDMENWLSDKLNKIEKYINILIFEFLFTVIIMISFYRSVDIFLCIGIILFIIVSVFLLLSRYAVAVKSHFNQVIYKLKLICSEKHKFIDNEEIQTKIKEFADRYKQHPKWWGIRIIIIEDINETIRNIGNIEIRKR